MTATKVVKTSVTDNRSPFQDHTHSANLILSTYDMTLGFKPFTEVYSCHLHVIVAEFLGNLMFIFEYCRIFPVLSHLTAELQITVIYWIITATEISPGLTRSCLHLDMMTEQIKYYKRLLLCC